MSGHDTFDVSSQSSSSCKACRAVLFDKLDTAKMHGLDTSNVSCRVERWRDEPSGIWVLRRCTHTHTHTHTHTLRRIIICNLMLSRLAPQNRLYVWSLIPKLSSVRIEIVIQLVPHPRCWYVCLYVYVSECIMPVARSALHIICCDYYVPSGAVLAFPWSHLQIYHLFVQSPRHIFLAFTWCRFSGLSL